MSAGWERGNTAWHLLTLLLVFAVPRGAGASFDSDRGWEIVSVEGRAFPAAFRVDIPRLTLWRMTDNGLQPMRFQIDERDRKGRLALPNGPKPSHDESPDVFDDNDLLVFTARDLGGRAHVAGAAEIQVTDPITRTSRWAYLRLDAAPAHPGESAPSAAGATPHVEGSAQRTAATRDVPGPSAAPQAPSDGVAYDDGTHVIRARDYSLTLGPHVPTGFSFANGHHGYGRNLLDRLKARVTAQVFWGLLQFHRDEEDVTATLLAWKSGPVRVIQRTGLGVRLGYGLQPPKIVAEDFYTADFSESPIIVRLPFDLRYVFGDLTVRIFLDFDDLHDARIFAAGQAPVPIGCDQPLPQVNGIATTWFGVTAADGTFIHALRVSPTLQALRSSLYAVADRTPDPPERVPGNCPGVGYTLTEWSSMSHGTHRLNMVTRAFEHFTPGDEQAFLTSLQNPLMTTVGPPPSE